MTHINWNDSDPLFINPKFGVDLQGKAPKGIPLPTYGNYGGPNISGPKDPVDALDALFQAHDKAIDDDAMSNSETPGVLTPDELVAAHAELFNGINLQKSRGLIDDAGATLYAGFTIFGLTAQLAQLSLLEELEVALVDFSKPKARSDLFDPLNPNFDDVAAALNDAQGYMESGLAGLTPEEKGEARSLNGLLSIFENQFEDYFMA